MIEKGKTKVGGCSIYIGNFAGYFNYRQTSRLDPFENNYLYLIRPVRSFKPFQKIGHIVLTTKISHIRDIIDQNVHNLQGEDARYIFSSGEDVVVCSDDGSFIGDTVSSLTENMKTIKTMGRNGSLVKYNGQLGWMVSETSEYSECTFTLIIPMTVIMASLKKPISFAILISLLFAVVTVFISRYITKQRLRRLQVPHGLRVIVASLPDGTLKISSRALNSLIYSTFLKTNRRISPICFQHLVEYQQDSCPAEARGISLPK